MPERGQASHWVAALWIGSVVCSSINRSLNCVSIPGMGTRVTVVKGMLVLVGMSVFACDGATPPTRVKSVQSALLDKVSPFLNNNVCDGSGGVASCASGQVLTGTSSCVTPVALDSQCYPAGSTQHVCEDRWDSSCIRQGDGTYKCRSSAHATDPGLFLLANCTQGSIDELCPADTWCRDASNCSSSWSANRCVVHNTQGELCDGDTSDYPYTDECRICAPGTDCVAAGAAPPGFDGYCRKSCTVDSDCPCDSDGSQIHACTNGYCYECKGQGEVCNDGQYTCCDDDVDLRCGGNGRCCRNEQEVCSSNADCCIGSFCNDAEECQKCAYNGDTCSSDADCCGGNDCVGGICKTPCSKIKGDPCGHTLGGSAKGECKANAEWKCEGTYDAVCTPAGSEPEKCDGKDNDCDGDIDESPTDTDIGMSCQIEPSGCHSGFKVDSVMICNEDGDIVCDPDVQDAYCVKCGTAPGINCGGCAGDPCASDADCPPNAVCNGSNKCSAVVSGCPTVAGYCWLPSDVSDSSKTCNYP